jgi:transcriptional regulator with XRE-family HTH domain
VSDWETQKKDPSGARLKKLAEIFSVDPLVILGVSVAPPADEDEDLWRFRERLRRDPEYRMLFSAAEKATPDPLRAAAAMLKSLETPVWPGEETEPQEFPE